MRRTPACSAAPAKSRCLPVFPLKVLRPGHQVDEVVGGVNALQRLVRANVDGEFPGTTSAVACKRDRSLLGFRARHLSFTPCFSSRGISLPPT